MSQKTRSLLDGVPGRGRVVIESVQPRVDDGEFPIKRVVGDTVSVEADVFADGHDLITAELQYRVGCDGEWMRLRMQPLVNDRWQAEFAVDRLGTYQYKVACWVDHFGTWRR